MADKEKALYSASFVYTDAILRDFEALYLEKKKLSPTARVVLGVLGGAGALFFGWMLYRDGLQFTRVAYLLVCSVLLVLAFYRGRGRPDDSVERYRKAYLNKRASFKFDSEAVEMKLEGQKSYARSKYREVYGLFDTAACFYLTIKGRAYYILPKAAFSEEDREGLKKFLQKKCAKKFQHFDLSETKGETA
ncbi:MAG: YcxB family protein [Oscillospiraceae bacterium]|nr:YcxB family protein [Oscillospiraceae bacterium]